MKHETSQFDNKSAFSAFRHALDGLKWFSMENKRPWQYPVAFTVNLTMGYLFSINGYECALVLLVTFGIIIAETTNTAIEYVVDLACGMQYHELAKKAKDVAAGTVFVAHVTALVVGGIIYFPKMF